MGSIVEMFGTSRLVVWKVTSGTGIEVFGNHDKENQKRASWTSLLNGFVRFVIAYGSERRTDSRKQ
jgi:hypothetical protein